MKRLIWFSDSILITTGYGKIGMEVLQGLHKKGYESVNVPKSGFMGKTIDLGFTSLVSVSENNSFDMMAVQAKLFQPDYIVMMVDIWAYNIAELRKMIPKSVIISYLPVDTDGLPMGTSEQLEYIDYIIPMSKHAEKLLKEKVSEEKLIDVIYPPIPECFKFNADQQGKRDRLGFYGYDRVVTMVQMLRDLVRKDQIRQFMAVRDAAEKTGLKVGIYAHMVPSKKLDLKVIAREIGFEDIRHAMPDAYLAGFTDEQMAEIYNVSDLVLQCTMGEGWGMPTGESILCGTPVVGVKNTATEELVEGSWPEYAVEAKELQMLNIAPSYIASYDDMVDKIAMALTEAKKDPERGENLRELTHPDFVIGQWIKAFEEVDRRFEVACKAPPELGSELIANADMSQIIEVKK